MVLRAEPAERSAADEQREAALANKTDVAVDLDDVTLLLARFAFKIFRVTANRIYVNISANQWIDVVLGADVAAVCVVNLCPFESKRTDPRWKCCP